MKFAFSFWWLFQTSKDQYIIFRDVLEVLSPNRAKELGRSPSGIGKLVERLLSAGC